MNRSGSPDKLNPSSSYHNDYIKITNAELHDLAIDDYKFEQKIKDLNQQGVNLINLERQNEALTYLLEAERILEYAASCGKTIDRVLITATLQNEACAYQRLWDLEKSSDYMEAIIYNIKASLDSTPFIQCDSSVKDQQSLAYSQLSTFVSRRIQAAFYYLQFSAVNSQINRHNCALQSTKKALLLIENACKECLKYERVKKGKNSILMEDLINSFNFESQRPRGVLAEAKQALLSIKRHRQFFSFDITLIQNFVIGEVMQMSTITIEQATKKPKIQEEITHLSIIYKVLYLSICYFVMGTELRLISKQKGQSDVKSALVELNTSKMYHLYAIKIAATLAPCQSKYLQHLVKSFKNHYEIDLYADDYMMEEASKMEFNCVKEFQQDQVENNKFLNEMETPKYCYDNTKGNTFEAQELEGIPELTQRHQKLEKTINKPSKSPMLKNKKKPLKKEVGSKSRTLKFGNESPNIYIFPTKKSSRVKQRSKEKDLEIKVSKQKDDLASSRQKFLNDRFSRACKIKQEYFTKEGGKPKKNKKGNFINRSRSKQKIEEVRSKKNNCSKEKTMKICKR